MVTWCEIQEIDLDAMAITFGIWRNAMEGPSFDAADWV